ncbi:MAG: hypothetical protein HC936_10455 [Leptolyngbyaceae cyanobacterium SU_3_3]|nr:hypothetical protein [Leptolyngbyaceae cyanobacterium SU_3_3]
MTERLGEKPHGESEQADEGTTDRFFPASAALRGPAAAQSEPIVTMFHSLAARPALRCGLGAFRPRIGPRGILGPAGWQSHPQENPTLAAEIRRVLRRGTARLDRRYRPQRSSRSPREALPAGVSGTEPADCAAATAAPLPTWRCPSPMPSSSPIVTVPPPHKSNPPTTFPATLQIRFIAAATPAKILKSLYLHTSLFSAFRGGWLTI